MRVTSSQIAFASLALSILAICGMEPTSISTHSAKDETGIRQSTTPILETRSNAVEDFEFRFQAAVTNRSIAAIEALYRTNLVDAKDLRLELDWWQKEFHERAEIKANFYFKELAIMPHQIRMYWMERAPQLAKKGATHLVQVFIGGKSWRMFGLILAEDKLWIVVSNWDSRK